MSGGLNLENPIGTNAGRGYSGPRFYETLKRFIITLLRRQVPTPNPQPTSMHRIHSPHLLSADSSVCTMQTWRQLPYQHDLDEGGARDPSEVPLHRRWWTWPNVIEAERCLANAFMEKIPDYPAATQDRGVVVVGGGKYLASAYVTVKVLRHVGCRLPIELWHLEDETDAWSRALFSKLGVACKDADALRIQKPFRFLDNHWWKGWQLKAYALLHCGFEQVLLLDADCYPVCDPTFLFEHPQFQQHGAIFWPCGGVPGPGMYPAQWQAFGMPMNDDMAVESGQLLVDRRKNWRPLNLAAHYNAQADYTYRHIWGDKDTFPIAWRRLESRYGCLWPTGARTSAGSLQFDDRHQPLFHHRAMEKFVLQPSQFSSSPQDSKACGNRFHPELPHEAFCHAALQEFRVAQLAA